MAALKQASPGPRISDARRSKGEMPQANMRGIEDGVSDGSGSDGNCGFITSSPFE
jgi:hypothetical protein